MQCIYCGCPESRVTDTSKVGRSVIRERVCQSCHKRYWTEETSPVKSQVFLMKQLNKNRELNRKKERNSAKGYLDGSNARQV